MTLKSVMQVLAVALSIIAFAIMMAGAFECQGLKAMEGLWANSALGLFVSAFIAGGLGQ